MNYLKTPTFRSEKWLRAVASLPCVRCYREGMTQAAHRNEGKAMGMKTDDCWTAALCVECHSEMDQGKSYSRDEKREMMNVYILLTLRELARKGLVRV